MVKAAAAGISINIPVDLDEEGIKNFNDALGKSNSRITNVNRSGGLMSRMVRGMIRGFSSLGSAAGTALGNMFSLSTGAATTMGKLGGALGSTVGVLGVVTIGVGLLSGAIGVLASLVLAAAGAVGALAAAAPTLLSAFGPPVAAVMIGMDGIKKAAEVLTPAFDHMKRSVSAAFEQGMRPVFEHLLSIMPLLTDELGHVATRLSGVAHEAAMFLESAQGVRIIKDIFAGFGIVLDRAKAGMGELGRQVLITAGHAPTLRVLGDIIANMSNGIAGFIEKARESGRLTATFGTLRDVLAAAGRWLQDLVIAGMDFLTAAGPGITAFFDNLRNAFSQVDFQALGRAFGGMLASLSNLDPATVANFFRSIEMLFNAIRDFINSGVMDILLATFANFTAVLSGMINVLATVGGWFAKLYHWAAGTPEKMNQATGSVTTGMTAMSGAAATHSADAANSFQTNMGRIPPAAQAAGAGASKNLSSSLLPMPGAAQRIGQQTTGNITAGLRPMPTAAQHVANITKGNMGRGLAPMPGEAGRIATDTARKLDSGLKSGDPGGAGRAAGQGFINGLKGFLGAAASAGRSLGLAAWNAAKAAIGYGSPAKEFIKLGLASGEGFIIGIHDMLGGIIQAMRQVMKRTEAAGGWATLGHNIAQQMATGLNTALPDMVRLGTVSDEVWNQLLASGWKGDPNDRMEALYRPKDSGTDLYDAVFSALNGARMMIDGSGVARLVSEQRLRNGVRA